VAEMLQKGQESARVLRRASILRQLNGGQRVAQAAENAGVAEKTVRAIARRYEEGGLDAALYEKPRPGRERVLNTGQKQRIVAMVCGPPRAQPFLSLLPALEARARSGAAPGASSRREAVRGLGRRCHPSLGSGHGRGASGAVVRCLKPLP